MSTPLPGITGSLLPGGYLASGLASTCGSGAGDVASVDDAAISIAPGSQEATLRAWWRDASSQCGPASGLRTLFDVVAMPLFAALGFRARRATFEPDAVSVHLETRDRTPVGLVVLPWARRPAVRWRSLVETGHAAGAHWCFLLGTPFLSLVDVRGRAVRRSQEFVLPDALDPRSIDRFCCLCRADAFDRASGASIIDRIVAQAARFQDRVRTDLQRGVVDAIAALEPALARPAGDRAQWFQESLTLIYRVLFLLFAESRDLVPRRHPVYGRAYAVRELCRTAVRDGGAAIGVWDGLAAITRLSRTGCRSDDLIVRPFNGRLFARGAAPSLELSRRAGGARRTVPHRDAALARALVAVGTRPGRGGREEIAYADLGVEQLGAVYERVLDLDPTEIDRRTSAAATASRRRESVVARREAAGTRHSLQRKQTGTFYTPQALAEFVVRRTLAPLVRGASTEAILSLRVVDPAVGSGAFLVAACRYLTAAYERALLDEGRCAETDLDAHAHARHRRLVAERCLSGVDANPTAVQLARLSLWLTTLARGKPLSFLDHRLRVGNSLIGAGPDDLWRVGAVRAGAAGALPLLEAAGLEHTMRLAARPLVEFAQRPDDSVADVRAKEAVWRRLTQDQSPLAPWRLACSMWCARFFWPPGGVPAPSSQELRAAIAVILHRDRTLSDGLIGQWIAISRHVAGTYGFFHWPLEFADVFYDEDGSPQKRPGFDAVIGNPPWEMLRKEPGRGDASTGEASGRGRSLVDFIRHSGHYPSCDRGQVNLYQPFLERALSIARKGGRVGLILPWGLATDDGAAALRARLIDREGLDTLVGLDNGAGLFPIHRGLRFGVIAGTVGEPSAGVRARFGIRTSEEIEALADNGGTEDDVLDVRLERDVLAEAGGPARRIPDIRRRRDLDWLLRVAREFPRLGDARGWQARFGRELNVTEDRGNFGLAGLPVVAGRHIGAFAVDAVASPMRIAPEAAERLLPDRRYARDRLGYRDVSGFGNRQPLIAAIVPGGVVTTHTIFCLRSPLPRAQQHFLCALFNSYVLNAVVRMLMGTHVTTSLVESLPAPVWTGAPAERRIARLAAWLARRPGASGVQAALQAGVGHLFGFDAPTFASIVESFPLVPRADRDAAVRAFTRSSRVSGGV